jgi:PPOX class probable F420-dependent enzyme
MDAAEARRRFAAARVARLATIGPDGRPHLVPITFAAIDADTIVTAVDHKPKRTTALQRLANIERDPRVAVLADHYDDDWSKLWWVRADGVARVLRDSAAAQLADKYPQYRDRPPSGTVIVIEVERWSGWASAP